MSNLTNFGSASRETRELPVNLPGVLDARGTLPMAFDYATVRDKVYGHRSITGVTRATLHYTASPASGTPAGIASAQLQRDAAPGQKFPGLAYHYIVDQSGAVYWAWDLDVRVWHSAGTGVNDHSVGICYIGDVAPNQAQVEGIAAAIYDAQLRIGRKLVVGGHMDDYATECPGPQWPGWLGAVMANVPD